MTQKTEGRPIKKNGYSHAKLDAKRDCKRREAKARQEECNKRTLKERMDLCCRRRGDSSREFHRLQVKLEGQRKAAK